MRTHLIITCAALLIALATQSGCAVGELTPEDGSDLSGDMSRDMGRDMPSPADMPGDMPPLDMPHDMPNGQDMPADMRVDEDMGADMSVADMPADMAVEDMGVDMASPPDMAQQPCNGLCTGPTQECRNGTQCVDVCQVQSRVCGDTTKTDGSTVSCGDCMSGLACVSGQCVNVCAQADAACGPITWDGVDASCGAACGAGETCAFNQCAAAGYHGVSAGFEHVCATRSGGAVRCWGNNSAGQLGDGGVVTSSDSPLQLSIGASITQLSATSQHTCALDSAARVWCWGSNLSGQLGTGDTTPRTSPTRLTSLTGVRQVTAGASHSCALMSTGAVKCWGYNEQGQLGDGSNVTTTAPVDTKNLTDAVQIDAGNAHTCAVLRDGSARCWGYNGLSADGGRLGTGNTVSRSQPTTVVGLTDARQISAGNTHSCAVTQSGTIYCWGDNAYGQLGDGTTTRSLTPTPVLGITRAIHVSAGNGHTCAIVMRSGARQTRCWGRNDFGQLGQDNTTQYTAPRDVTTLTDTLTLTTGNLTTCATTRAGQAYCWGRNHTGQLGVNDTTDRDVPTRVP